MIDSALFKPETIKTRLMPLKYMLAGGEEKAFFHIEVKLLKGRTDAQKQTLSEKLKLAAMRYVKEATIEIVDLSEHYYP